MTGVGPKRYLIRLRWERGAYVSSTMPQAEAEEKASELEKLVFDCGDGPGFVRMTGHDGRTIRIRARELIGIECNPHIEDREVPAPAATPAGSTVVTGGTITLQMEGGPALEHGGTDFLRQQAARRPQGARR